MLDRQVVVRPPWSRVRPIVHTWQGSLLHVAGLAAAWMGVAALSHLTGPKVDPTNSIDRPLESFGTLALVLPCAVTAELLTARVPWLTATSSRRLPLWRGARLTALVAAQIPALWAVTVGTIIPLGHLLCVWGLLLASTVIALSTAGRFAAGAAPSALVIAFTQGTGTPPWSWNIIYNLERSTTLHLTAAVVGVVAAACYVRMGDRSE